jgi:hypothetical protein
VAKGLAAAIYTQTSDVETEVNGVMSYDRKVLKLDPERASAAAAKLYNAPPVFRFILPAAEQAAGMIWNYSTREPEGDWYDFSFDDSEWSSGQAGFGYRGRYRVFGNGTAWDTTDLWLRREFLLEEIPEGRILLNFVSFNCISAVYLNGEKLAVLSPTKDHHQTIDLDMALKRLLREGRNVIAVYAYSKDAPTDQGRGIKIHYADYGLIEEEY